MTFFDRFRVARARAAGSGVAVPWRLEWVRERWRGGRVVVVRNCSSRVLFSVRVLRSRVFDGSVVGVVAGGVSARGGVCGVLEGFGLSLPCSVLPGEVLRLCEAGLGDSRRDFFVVRWFEEDGREFLWPVVF